MFNSWISSQIRSVWLLFHMAAIKQWALSIHFQPMQAVVALLKCLFFDHYYYYVYKLVNFRVENKRKEMKNNKERRIRGNLCVWSWPPPPLSASASTPYTCLTNEPNENLLRFVSVSTRRWESNGFSTFKFRIDRCVCRVVMFWFCRFVGCLCSFLCGCLCGFSYIFLSQFSSARLCILRRIVFAACGRHIVCIRFYFILLSDRLRYRSLDA